MQNFQRKAQLSAGEQYQQSKNIVAPHTERNIKSPSKLMDPSHVKPQITRSRQPSKEDQKMHRHRPSNELVSSLQTRQTSSQNPNHKTNVEETTHKHQNSGSLLSRERYKAYRERLRIVNDSKHNIMDSISNSNQLQQQVFLNDASQNTERNGAQIQTQTQAVVGDQKIISGAIQQNSLNTYNVKNSNNSVSNRSANLTNLGGSQMTERRSTDGEYTQFHVVGNSRIDDYPTDHPFTNANQYHQYSNRLNQYNEHNQQFNLGNQTDNTMTPKTTTQINEPLDSQQMMWSQSAAAPVEMSVQQLDQHENNTHHNLPPNTCNHLQERQLGRQDQPQKVLVNYDQNDDFYQRHQTQNDELKNLQQSNLLVQMRQIHQRQELQDPTATRRQADVVQQEMVVEDQSDPLMFSQGLRDIPIVGSRLEQITAQSSLQPQNHRKSSNPTATVNETNLSQINEQMKTEKTAKMGIGRKTQENTFGVNYQQSGGDFKRNSSPPMTTQDMQDLLRLKQHLESQNSNTNQGVSLAEQLISKKLISQDVFASNFQQNTTKQHLSQQQVKVEDNNILPGAQSQLNQEQPTLYVHLKEENKSLVQRVENLESLLHEEQQKNADLIKKKDLMHQKLEKKDKSIAKIHLQLQKLKDDIQIVNENLAQARKSAEFIRSEDETLNELAQEISILLADCHKKTVVKEDERGNLTIGQLDFVDEEMFLIHEYNNATNSAVSNTEELLYEIKIALEQKLQQLKVSASSTVNQTSNAAAMTSSTIVDHVDGKQTGVNNLQKNLSQNLQSVPGLFDPQSRATLAQDKASPAPNKAPTSSSHILINSGHSQSLHLENKPNNESSNVEKNPNGNNRPSHQQQPSAHFGGKSNQVENNLQKTQQRQMINLQYDPSVKVAPENAKHVNKTATKQASLMQKGQQQISQDVVRDGEFLNKDQRVLGQNLVNKNRVVVGQMTNETSNFTNLQQNDVCNVTGETELLAKQLQMKNDLATIEGLPNTAIVTTTKNESVQSIGLSGIGKTDDGQLMFLKNQSAEAFSGSTLQTSSKVIHRQDQPRNALKSNQNQNLTNSSRVIHQTTQWNQSNKVLHDGSQNRLLPLISESLLERLHRDVKLYVEKCSQLVLSSKKEMIEAQARARARDESIIELEMLVDRLQKESVTLREEIQIVTADCLQLEQTVQANQHKMKIEKGLQAEMREQNEAHLQEIGRLQKRLSQTKSDFSNLNEMRRQEADTRHSDIKTIEKTMQVQIQQLTDELKEIRRREKLTEKKQTEVRNKLKFEAEDAKFNLEQNKLRHEAQIQTKETEIENLRLQILQNKRQRKEEFDREFVHNLQQKVHQFEVQLVKEKKKSQLFEELITLGKVVHSQDQKSLIQHQSDNETSDLISQDDNRQQRSEQISNLKIQTGTLLKLINFILKSVNGKKMQSVELMNKDEFSLCAKIFGQNQHKIVEAYETKICQLNQLKSSLVQELKRKVFELQRFGVDDPDLMTKLREDDKVLSQFVLEEESCCSTIDNQQLPLQQDQQSSSNNGGASKNLFDWIRDFKDYEIRKQMQTAIDELKCEVAEKDKEISTLKVQIEQIYHELATQGDSRVLAPSQAQGSAHQNKLDRIQRNISQIEFSKQQIQQQQISGHHDLDKEIQQQIQRNERDHHQGVVESKREANLFMGGFQGLDGLRSGGQISSADFSERRSAGGVLSSCPSENRKTFQAFIEREQETISVIQDLKEALMQRDQAIQVLQQKAALVAEKND